MTTRTWTGIRLLYLVALIVTVGSYTRFVSQRAAAPTTGEMHVNTVTYEGKPFQIDDTDAEHCKPLCLSGNVETHTGTSMPKCDKDHSNRPCYIDDAGTYFDMDVRRDVRPPVVVPIPVQPGDVIDPNLSDVPTTKLSPQSVFATKDDLLDALHSLSKGQLVLVGYVGDDGDFHALTEKDLRR